MTSKKKKPVAIEVELKEAVDVVDSSAEVMQKPVVSDKLLHNLSRHAQQLPAGIVVKPGGMLPVTIESDDCQFVWTLNNTVKYYLTDADHSRINHGVSIGVWAWK